MNSSTTWRLFLAAVAVFLFIYYFESRNSGGAGSSGKPPVFGRIDPLAITSVEVQRSNAVIRADRTNDTWRLTVPYYPAQSTPIESFIATLRNLRKQEVISASEVSTQPGKFKDYGLDPPLATVAISQGSNRFLLNVGARTPLVDQVYVQTPGSGEVLVTDGALLKAMPVSPNDWRSPLLLHLTGRPFDHIQIRAGPRALEFERNETNQLWRITKPTPARANNERITQLLQQLTAARVKQFVTDSFAADLERYGLQTPDLELSFWLDTNRVTALDFGASPTNDPTSVYVRRATTTNIVLVARELFETLSFADRKAYHDPRLLSIDPNSISMIQINRTNGFTIVRQTNGLWKITEPTPMAADSELMKIFLNRLQEMEIVDFAKDVPTDADLKQFGLVPPRYSISLFTLRTNATGAITNTLLTQLDLGHNKSGDTLYARRSDETPVYVTPAVGVIDLPRAPWHLRDLRVFDFQTNEIAGFTLSLGPSSNRYSRRPQGWTDDPIHNAAIDEALYRITRLRARQWVATGADRLPLYGITPEGLTVTFEIVRGGKTNPVPLKFGKRAIRNNIYAAATLPGDTEPTAFVFPGEFYDELARAIGLPN